MSQPPPQININQNQYTDLDQMRWKDLHNLKLLSVFHYVKAGLSGLGLLFIIFHAIIMMFVMNVVPDIEAQAQANNNNQTESLSVESSESLDEPSDTVILPVENSTLPPDQALGLMKGFLILIYVIAGLLIITSIVINVLAARYLKQQKNKTFTYVVAVINCLSIPLGTVLGVFTLVILSKSSVEQLYQEKI